MNKKLTIGFIVVLLLSNYATYEITKNILFDDIALMLKIIKFGELVMNGYKVITDSEYKTLTTSYMKSIASEPLWWESNFSKQYYRHINASEVYNITIKENYNDTGMLNETYAKPLIIVN